MFEVGFSELFMVALVALLVIGPEKLPKAARLTGFWLGKLRTMVESVKTEVNEELRAEEMRQLIREQSGFDEIRQLHEEVIAETFSIQSSLNHTAEAVTAQSELNDPEKN